jgi:TRAP-type C4-dicarboxylate transport system permease small subunit
MLRSLERGLLTLSIGLIVAIVLLMTIEIVLRYSFSLSTRISEEYSGYLFCAATLAAFFPALTTGRFLRIPALISRLPDRLRAVAEVLIALVSAGFCLILTWQTWDLFRMSVAFGSRSEQYSETPLMYPQVLLPLGLGLLAVGMLLRGAQLAHELWNGNRRLAKDEVNVVD